MHKKQRSTALNTVDNMDAKPGFSLRGKRCARKSLLGLIFDALEIGNIENVKVVKIPEQDAMINGLGYMPSIGGTETIFYKMLLKKIGMLTPMHSPIKMLNVVSDKTWII